MTEDKTMKLLNLSPGDILVEKWDKREVGRYIILNKSIIRRPSDITQRRVQYDTIILYYSREAKARLGHWFVNPGSRFIITDGHLSVNKGYLRTWEVVVESGLSWIE